MRSHVYTAQLPAGRRDVVTRGFFVARPGHDGEADWVLSEQTDSLQVAHWIADLDVKARPVRFLAGGTRPARAFTVAELGDELVVIEAADSVDVAWQRCHVHEVPLAA